MGGQAHGILEPRPTPPPGSSALDRSPWTPRHPSPQLCCTPQTLLHPSFLGPRHPLCLGAECLQVSSSPSWPIQEGWLPKEKPRPAAIDWGCVALPRLDQPGQQCGSSPTTTTTPGSQPYAHSSCGQLPGMLGSQELLSRPLLGSVSTVRTLSGRKRLRAWASLSGSAPCCPRCPS